MYKNEETKDFRVKEENEEVKNFRLKEENKEEKDVRLKEMEEYSKLVKKLSPNSRFKFNCLKAFLVGGVISSIGQYLLNLYIKIGFSKEDSFVYTSITLILFSIILTSLGLYSKLGKFAGGGSVIPITGFANAVASSAIEFRKEGLILGMAAKMFVLAGPVIVYGIITSSIVGFIHFLLM